MDLWFRRIQNIGIFCTLNMMQEILQTKICAKCEIEKPYSEFNKSQRGRLGLQNYCRPCFKQIKTQKTTVECTAKISNQCRTFYEINISELKKNHKRNNGQYRCLYCGIEATHLNDSKYTINKDFFKTIDNEIKAYLLGVIAGDGHLSANGYLEVVANKQDIETLKLIKKNISPDNVIRQHGSSKNCQKIIICSRVLCEDVSKILDVPLGKKSDKITLPNIEEKLLIHFIRGLMDTDGWIKEIKPSSSGRRCFYSSTSKKILEQIQNLLHEKFSIKSKIEKIKLVLNGDAAQKFLELLYEEANYFLSRKHDRFINWRK